MKNFHQHIQNYFGAISLEESKIIEELFQAKRLKKGAYLVKEQNYCRDFAFVSTGVLRTFKVEENKEVTQWLAGPDSFITELSSFLFDELARWNIQAIEDVELYSISKSNYEQLKTRIPRWTEMEKQFLAKCFAVLESRVYSHLALSAEERYNHYTTIYPELSTKVPLQYLASLLGMSPETLSRIRKKQSIS